MTFEQTRQLYEEIRKREDLWHQMNEAAVMLDDDVIAARADKVEDDIFEILEWWYENEYLSDSFAFPAESYRETEYLCQRYCAHVMAYHSEDYVVLSKTTKGSVN